MGGTEPYDAYIFGEHVRGAWLWRILPHILNAYLLCNIFSLAWRASSSL